MSELGTTFLVVNPKAGRVSAARREGEVERFCAEIERHGGAAEVRRTSAPGDATRFAAEAARAGKAAQLVVCGGDGTVNEALQGLAGTGARLALAVWPRGTANVLAKELRMPARAEQVAGVVARGRARRVHLGRAIEERTGEGRYFLLMAGVGLDASVVRGVPPRLKKRVGEAAFWYAGLGHLARWSPTTFRVEIEGHTYAATFAAVGKSPRYGGNLAITPRARLDSASFEVCLVDSRSRLRYLYLLSHALRRGGVRERAPGVRFVRAARLRAEGDAPVQLDGELVGQLPMIFEVSPHTIELLVP